MKTARSGAFESGPWDAVVAFPRMRIGIRTDATCVTRVAYLPPQTPLQPARSALAARAVAQLERYRDHGDDRFDLPLAQSGTRFRRRVWAALRRIPRGQTRTYGALAHELGSAARAVGQACGDNPLPLIVPCHRVVAAHSLGGFAHHGDGFFVDVKRWLLSHEGAS